MRPGLLAPKQQQHMKIGDSHGAKPFVKINLTEYLSHFHFYFYSISKNSSNRQTEVVKREKKKWHWIHIWIMVAAT